MPTPAGFAYLGALTILFFFWIYGIVSFYFDLRHRFLPRLYAWLRDDGDKRHVM